MRLFVSILVLLCGVLPAYADAFARHFFGSDVPRCSAHRDPIVLVTDITLTGEIDDSNSLVAFARLERAGCVDVRAIVSIFGNGGSTTAAVHRNLEVRLRELGLWHRWGDRVVRGPDRSMTARRRSDADDARYRAIAARVDDGTRPVTIVELGPMTVSATLLRDRYVSVQRIRRILGVGGRVLGESFGTGRGLGRFGSFTDFNIRKDGAAADHLVRHHGDKLTMVTYRTGIGARMVPASVVAESIPALATHAAERARSLARIGYAEGYIPSWDTWLSSFFVEGGPIRLGCARTRARMLAEEGAYNLRLILNRPIGEGHTIIACHHELKGP